MRKPSWKEENAREAQNLSAKSARDRSELPTTARDLRKDLGFHCGLAFLRILKTLNSMSEVRMTKIP